jgi:hypothetical protein
MSSAKKRPSERDSFIQESDLKQTNSIQLLDQEVASKVSLRVKDYQIATENSE